MSRLLQIQGQLRANGAQISVLERSLARAYSRSLESSLRSLYKVNDSLEEQLHSVAAEDGVDVISYRLFDGKDRASVALVGRAMDYFQTLYAVLYAAVSSKKPKDNSRLTAEAMASSSFDFAYAYSGSVGFVFTLPNERLLIGETYLDEAMEDLFKMAKSDGTDAVKSFAKTFGLAPIRAIYKWASALSDSSVGVDIQWRKNEAVKGQMVLQPAQVEALRNLIDLTSDLEVDENDITGVLVAFDIKSRTFKFEPLDDSATIRGHIGDAATLPPTVTIPKKYTARIKTMTRVRYATEQPEINNELQSLVARDQ